MYTVGHRARAVPEKIVPLTGAEIMDAIRVLGVDDEPQFLELFRETIDRDSRMRVSVACSVEDAMLEMDAGEFDVIVCDYQMPRADGISLLRTLRRAGNDIPFILLTGRGGEDVAIMALNDGADFYLQKTTDTKVMFSQLLNMIVQSHRRRSSDKARSEALERFERYADSSRDLVYRMRIKPVPCMEYFSPCVRDFVGYEAEEFYGNPELIYRCLHPDDLELFAREVANPKTPERPVVFRWLHKDGHVVYAEDTWVPVRDGTGEIVAVDGMSRNVTDRVLAQEGLRQANKKLELIASLIRHDTLNRLTSILASIDVIRSVDPETAKKYLGRIEVDAKLIARQLQFSSDYQRTVSGHPSWIRVRNVVEKVVSSWAWSGVQFEISLPDLEVLSDYVLERIFSNLVEDSLTHGEHVKRVVFSYQKAENGVDVIYEDDGVGIPTKEKELIFERGYGKGSGYGLYLTREILGVSGISIREEGEFGVGAKFVIHFPRESSRITTVES